MIEKFIVFGSCHTAGVELWSDKTIPDYSNMDPLIAAVRSDPRVYIDHIQNGKFNKDIPEQIEYETNNSWVNALTDHFPNTEVINTSVAQSNLKNFLKASTYFLQNQIDKTSTCIIIEITEPTGITVCQDNMLKYGSKQHLGFYFDEHQAELMNSYLDSYESARYRAYLDIVFLYNLIGNLRNQGYNAQYFLWNRTPWTRLLSSTDPIKMFQPQSNDTDMFDKLFHEFLQNSLITVEQETEIKQIPLLPHGHMRLEAHALLGKFISKRIMEIV
jgi:hypothetical protein